jgi:hypothetical protein
MVKASEIARHRQIGDATRDDEISPRLTTRVRRGAPLISQS